MKIILDESVPQKLRLLIDSSLTAAEDGGFDLFITADQELSYQQNLTSRKTAVLVLSTNNWSLIKEQVAAITAAIDVATLRKVGARGYRDGRG